MENILILFANGIFKELIDDSAKNPVTAVLKMLNVLQTRH